MSTPGLCSDAASALAGKAPTSSSSALLSSTFLSAGNIDAIGTKYGVVDVGKGPFREVMDAVGAWSKRASAARALFQDSAAQASSARATIQRGVSPPRVSSSPKQPPLRPSTGVVTSRAAKRLQASLAFSSSSTSAAGAAPTASTSTHGQVLRSLASPLRPGFRAPCGLQSFNWTGLLGPDNGANGRLRDPLLDAPLPEAAEKDPTLRALIRLQRARVLAAAHATAREQHTVVAPSSSSSSSTGTAISRPPRPASAYSRSERDSKWVTKALFQSASGGRGFDGGRGGSDSTALASAGASAGEVGYAWRTGSAGAFTNTTGASAGAGATSKRAVRLPTKEEMVAGRENALAVHTSRVSATTQRAARMEEEDHAFQVRRKAREDMAGDTMQSRADFTARSKMAALIVTAVCGVVSLKGAVENAGARVVETARRRRAVDTLGLWYSHWKRMRLVRRRRVARTVITRFLLRWFIERRRERQRVTAGRLVAAFLTATATVTPAARVLLAFRMQAAAMAVITKHLKAHATMVAVQRRTGVMFWRQVETSVRVEWGRKLAMVLLSREGGGKVGATNPGPKLCALMEALECESIREGVVRMKESMSIEEAQPLHPKTLELRRKGGEEVYRANAQAMVEAWAEVTGQEGVGLKATKYVTDGAARIFEQGETSPRKDGVGGGAKKQPSNAGKPPGPGGDTSRRRANASSSGGGPTSPLLKPMEDMLVHREKEDWLDCLSLLRASGNSPLKPLPPSAPLSSPEALAPYLARWLLPPTTHAARDLVLREYLRVKSAERLVYAQLWRERVQALGPFVRREQAWERQQAALRGGGEEVAKAGINWPPPRIHLRTFPTREEITRLVEKELFKAWGVTMGVVV